jgi:protein-S-isoprenylcysteine O-methyltransferase Ste14
MKKNELKRKLHDDRDDLIGEHKFGDAGQLVLFFLFFIIWIVDCFVFQFSVILFESISLILKVPIALIVLGVAIFLAKASLKIIFDELRDKPEVIQKGVYRYIRHPMYLAAILLYLSFLIFKFSLAAFIVWLITLAFYHYIARYEEKLLAEHLGADYEKYKQTVSMWIPTFK